MNTWLSEMCIRLGLEAIDHSTVVDGASWLLDWHHCRIYKLTLAVNNTNLANIDHKKWMKVLLIQLSERRGIPG